MKLIDFETYYNYHILLSFSANKVCNGPFSFHTMLEGPWLHKTAFPTPMVWPLDEIQGSSPLQGHGSWLMCEVALSPYNNVSNTGLHIVAWIWLSNSSKNGQQKSLDWLQATAYAIDDPWSDMQWQLNPFSSRHCLWDILQIRIVNNKGRLHLAARSSIKQKWNEWEDY